MRLLLVVPSGALRRLLPRGYGPTVVSVPNELYISDMADLSMNLLLVYLHEFLFVTCAANGVERSSELLEH